MQIVRFLTQLFSTYFTKFQKNKTTIRPLLRQIGRRGTKIKHETCINCDKEILKEITDHSVASSAYHPHVRGIFQLYLLQLNLAGAMESFQLMKQQACLLQMYSQGMFVSNSTKEFSTGMITLCCQCILGILISLSKERDCLHFTKRC